MSCPICATKVERGGEFIPFCSKRCKLIDLSQWLEGRYRIPGESVDAPAPSDPDDGELQ